MFKVFQNLQLYLDNNLNILLTGPAGVGKTSVVKELFDKNFGDDWLFINAALADPFIDLLGIPRPTKDKDGNEFLEFIKPKKLQLNKVKAIFCDEYNRGKKATMNALLEVIQFKTLNNEPIPNLRVVWCAQNPDGEDYNIEEKLDKAQKDRFHIWLDVPNMIDVDYFTDKFGKEKAEGIQEFWKSLDDNAKKEISPRRMEYICQIHNMGGNIREGLPKGLNISKLTSILEHGTLESQIQRLMGMSDEDAKKALNINLISNIKDNLHQPKYLERFTHLLPEEILIEKAPANFEMCKYIKTNSNKFDTSIISTLDTMGCFTQSSFETTFNLMQKFFKDDSYHSRKRNKLKKVLKSLPEIADTKIKTADITNLQKLINITDAYCVQSYSSTVHVDNISVGFVPKFANIFEVNDKMKLGIQTARYSYRGLQQYVTNYIETEKKKAQQLQQPVQNIQTTNSVESIGATVQNPAVSQKPTFLQYPILRTK